MRVRSHAPVSPVSRAFLAADLAPTRGLGLRACALTEFICRTRDGSAKSEPMMLAWSFAARSVDEVLRLVRALSKHRYVQEVDHRLHWTVDVALREEPLFAEHAQAFAAR